MALTDYKVKEEDFNNLDITSLSDRPSADGMSAQALKERFDAGSKKVMMPAFNALIDYLLTSGASDIGITEIEGLEGKTTVQAVLEALKSEVNDKQSIENTKALVKNVEFDEKTGVFTFTKLDGTTKTIDTKAEKIMVSAALSGQSLVLTLVDGTELKVDLSSFFTVSEAKSLIKNIEYTENTGVFTVTKYDGSKFTINTAIEKIALDVKLDGQQFVLTLVDGTEQRVDLSAFIAETEVKDSDTVTLDIEDGAIVAKVVSKSITLAHLADEVTNKLTTAVNKNVASVKISNEKLVLTFVDGTTASVDIAGYLQESDLQDSSTVEFTVSDGKVVAKIADASISLAQLSEEVTKYIRQNAGASTAADWAENDEDSGAYVKNRTHWTEILVAYEETLPETTIAFTSELAACNGVGTDQITDGVDYIVTWNGTEYECTAHTYSGELYLGNSSLVGDTDNDSGEPFTFEILSATGSFIYKETTTAESITVRVERPEVVEYHKLAKEYLPDGIGGGADWAENDENAGGYIKGRTHWKETNTEIVEVFPETTATITSGKEVVLSAVLELVVGETYIVTWNGTEYECVAQEDTEFLFGGGLALGDITRASTGTATSGEPFVISVYSDSEVLVYSHDGSTAPVFSIRTETESEVVHKLPMEYLPDGYPYTEGGDGEFTEILPETVLTTTEDDAGLFVLTDTPITGVVIGEKYVVNWNGTEYTTSAALDGSQLDSGFAGQTVLVNDGANIATGENLTFVIIVIAETSWEEAGYYAILQDASGALTVTVSIYQGGQETVHKLDNKYLNLEWLPIKYEQISQLFADTVRISSSGYKLFDYSATPFSLTSGKSYSVTWNETDYECVAFVHGTGVAGETSYTTIGIGNRSIADSTLEDTGEPFFIMQMVLTGGTVHQTYIYGTENAVDVEFAISGPVVIPNTLPEEFLPEIETDVEVTKFYVDTNFTSNGAYDGPLCSDSELTAKISNTTLQNAWDTGIVKIVYAADEYTPLVLGDGFWVVIAAYNSEDGTVDYKRFYTLID